jgi:exodeoxyribonuclease VIII
MMDYYDHPGISNSKLIQFGGSKSPAHYKHTIENGWKETPDMLFGTGGHTLLFEPQRLKTDFYILDRSKMPNPNDDFRNKENKLWKKEQELINEGKKQLDSLDYQELANMQEVLFRHELASKLILECDQFEFEHYWTNDLGQRLKKKVDGIKFGHYQLDYKTCQSSDPKEFRRHAYKFKYHRQAGFYYEEHPGDFYFIAQEKTAPYAVTVFKCTPEFIQKGIEENRKDLIQLRACMEYNMWPGHEIKRDDFNSDGEVFLLDLPDYVIQNS